MMSRSAAEVVEDAARSLRLAEMAYEDYVRGHPNRRLAGLANCTVHGAAVTQVLRALKSKVDGYDEWWRPLSERLADPGFKLGFPS